MQGLRRPQVRIRGGTCEDPSQMMPGFEHSPEQEMPALYATQKMPPVSAYQRGPHMSQSSALPLGGATPRGKYIAPQQYSAQIGGAQPPHQFTGPSPFVGRSASVTTPLPAYAQAAVLRSASCQKPNQDLSINGSPQRDWIGPGCSQGAPVEAHMSLVRESSQEWHGSPTSPLHSHSSITSPSKEDSMYSNTVALNSANHSPPVSTTSRIRDADVAQHSLSRLSVQSGGSTVSTETGDILSDPAWQATAGDELAACRRFTFEQLQAATNNFSPSNYLGHGQFDAVYKGRLMGCKVAVKRLESTGLQGPIEYRTEVEVLSRMRHPNIVLLMGHCPEEHCLVYEFLNGGSLQHYLDKSKGCPPLKWFDRIKILGQVANALLFLHHHEPPIVHRDLIPGNVLIDRHKTVKLADVGLARLVHEEDMVTAGPKGTPGYIDPEEMITSEVSVLGDVYAFGLIGLQLLLGERSIMKLQRVLAEARKVGRTLSKTADVVMMMLDKSAGEWPQDLTRQLAVVLLRCAEGQRVRRPDLAEEVQPVVVNASERANAEEKKHEQGMDSQLICPLCKLRMTDPVLAADGFTYERRAIELWLQRSNESPVTGQPLAHTYLMPNNSLRQLL